MDGERSQLPTELEPQANSTEDDKYVTFMNEWIFQSKNNFNSKLPLKQNLAKKQIMKNAMDCFPEQHRWITDYGKVFLQNGYMRTSTE